MAQAMLNISVASGAIYGLLAGGALTSSDPAGFRVYFYISAGVYAATTIACAVLYKPPSRPTQMTDLRTKLQQLDWVGYGLLAFGVILVCMGLSWAQNPYQWKSTHVLAPFLVGLTLLLSLVWYEWKVRNDGLFHHKLFGSRNFAIVLFCVYIEGHAAFAANYFVPAQLSTKYPSMSGFRVGLCYAVSYCAFIGFTIAAGLGIAKTKAVRGPTVIGFLGLLVFFIITATATPATPEANFWGYMIFLGLGLGVLLTTLVVTAQLSTPPELIATASGLVLAARSLGASTGLVIYQAVFNAGLSVHLVAKVSEATLPLGLQPASLPLLITDLTTGNTASLSQIPGITPAIISAAGLAIQQAYSLAFSYVWAAAAAFTCLALIAAAFLQDNRKEFTATIDAPLDPVNNSTEQ
ncbi:hypothetical protein LTR27_008409 [Elasticomyces elasticus]|nr:hypothetical protein LTR27_008409 [Elasticomyces elasticus]